MTLGPTIAVWVKPPVDIRLRSILKPASLDELSTQARLIWLEEILDTINPLGDTGRDITYTGVLVASLVVSVRLNTKSSVSPSDA